MYKLLFMAFILAMGVLCTAVSTLTASPPKAARGKLNAMLSLKIKLSFPKAPVFVCFCQLAPLVK